MIKTVSTPEKSLTIYIELTYTLKRQHEDIAVYYGKVIYYIQ